MTAGQRDSYSTCDSWAERHVLYKQELDREAVTVQATAGQRDSYCTRDSWTETVTVQVTVGQRDSYCTRDSWTERQLLYKQQLDRETVTVQVTVGQRDSYCTTARQRVTVQQLDRDSYCTGNRWTEGQLLYKQQVDRETVTVQMTAGQRDSYCTNECGQRDSYCTSDSWTETVTVQATSWTERQLLYK